MNFCKKLTFKKCEKDSECWKEVLPKCMKFAQDPCFQKAAKICKQKDEPKKCFLVLAKKCKKMKEEEELEEELDDMLEEFKAKKRTVCDKKCADTELGHDRVKCYDKCWKAIKAMKKDKKEDKELFFF